MSSSSVCHTYAQTGACRYGSQCKFAHVGGVKLTDVGQYRRLGFSEELRRRVSRTKEVPSAPGHIPRHL
jgi:hypothetical protein